MTITTRIALFLSATSVFACAHVARQTVYLRPGQAVDLRRFDMHKQSLIVSLEAGEILPLDITVDGQFVASDPGASVALRVMQSCLVRVDDRGVRISADGRDFDVKAKKPGTFQFGLGVTDRGKRASLRIVTPTRAP